MLEETSEGFAVQVPDLAIVTQGDDVEDAKRAAVEAIRINMETYEEIGKAIPKKRPALEHLTNPEFEGLLFGFVDVNHQEEAVAV